MIKKIFEKIYEKSIISGLVLFILTVLLYSYFVNKSKKKLIEKNPEAAKKYPVFANQVFMPVLVGFLVSSFIISAINAGLIIARMPKIY